MVTSWPLICRWALSMAIYFLSLCCSISEVLGFLSYHLHTGQEEGLSPSAYEQGNVCQIALAEPGNCAPLKVAGKCFSEVRLALKAHLFSSNLPLLSCRHLLLASGPGPQQSLCGWWLGFWLSRGTGGWQSKVSEFMVPHSFRASLGNLQGAQEGPRGKGGEPGRGFAEREHVHCCGEVSLLDP